MKINSRTKTTWIVNHEGQEVKGENTWFEGELLFVNGQLQDKRFGLFQSNLTGHLINAKGEKEQIKVHLSGWFGVKCFIFINDKRVRARKL